MYMIPFVLLYVVGYAFLKKRDAYGDFVRGAGEGIHTAFAILPTLVGLMTAVGILRASGFLKWLSDILGRLFAGIGFPVQLVPLAVVRLFSASAATGFLLDIFKEFGPDSKIGIIASLMLSCTETVFLYDERLFYGSKSDKNTVYAGRCTAFCFCRDCRQLFPWKFSTALRTIPGSSRRLS